MANQSPIAGIILAAGESSRMGRDKALLPLGTQTFVERLLEVLTNVPGGMISPIIVVLGHHGDEIERQIGPALQRAPQARVVRNPDYKQGQLSSLKTALRALASDPAAPAVEGAAAPAVNGAAAPAVNGAAAPAVNGAVICLVDHPAITSAVVGQMLDRFAQRGAPVVIPLHLGRRGHPVLFAARLFPELLSAPVDQGARVVVRAHESEIDFVETGEESVLWDIDRPEDYEQLTRRWQSGPGR